MTDSQIPMQYCLIPRARAEQVGVPSNGPYSAGMPLHGAVLLHFDGVPNLDFATIGADPEHGPPQRPIDGRHGIINPQIAEFGDLGGDRTPQVDTGAQAHRQ